MLIKKSIKKVNICYISSLGGHFNQMLCLKGIHSLFPHFFITTKAKSYIYQKSLTDRMYFITDINEGRGLRNPLLFFKSLFQTLFIFIKERPSIVISTGAGIAVPGFILARLFCIPSLFIEAFTRIEKPSMAGKICHLFATRFLVQHEELINSLPKAVYKGTLYKHL